jgi:streptogramin lyase
MRVAALTLLALLVGCGASAAETARPKPRPVRIVQPGPLALAPDGALIVGDRALRRVVRLDLRTRRRTVVATGFPAAIVGLAYDDMGRLYVSAGDRIVRIAGRRKVLVAGTGARGHTGDGGPATVATLAGATGFDVDHDEGIAIAEYDNWIRVVTAGGTITSRAGNGETGYEGDGGPATAALLAHPHDVVWRRGGVLVIADSHNGVLRRIAADGTIATFATGFGAPIDLVGVPGDAFYVADAERGRIYRVGAAGGTPTVLGRASTPIGVTADVRGNAYVSELNARRVVRIAPNGRRTVLVKP